MLRLCCWLERRGDPGTEYARKLEQLHREEQLIQEEELEAKALVQDNDDSPSIPTGGVSTP